MTRVQLRTDEQAVNYLADRGYNVTETAAGPVVRVSRACPRCGGQGRGYWRPYGGVCFACAGAYTADQTEDVPVRDYARKVRRAELARLRREAEQAAARARNEAEAARKAEQREQARKAAEAARLQANAHKAHVGTVGKRRDFELTLERTFDWEGTFGVTFLLKFSDAAGNTIVLKTSSYPRKPDGNLLDTGDRVVLKGTVKAHNDYNGEPQTVVQRVKVLRAL